MNKQLIGLFGGTFDPIHRGHLQIAQELIDTLPLKAIHFIPNKSPTYRDKPEASADHRLAMAQIATAKNPQFIVNDIEMKRTGPTYTIDTITRIHQETPDQPFCLILGNDAFSIMNTWHGWGKIPELVHLIIINRPGITLPNLPWMHDLLEKRNTDNIQNLSSQPGGYVFQHTIKPIAMSATKIRQQLNAGTDLSDQLTPEVISYIRQHHLYQ
jgi:nicotinate-nucleotide adenylyltransferase